MRIFYNSTRVLTLNLIHRSIAVKSKWNHACMQKEMMMCVCICVYKDEMLTGLSCLFNYFSFFWLLCLLSLRVRPIGVVYRCSNLFFFFYSIILYVYINIYIYMRACVYIYICSLLYFDLIKSLSSQASRTSQVSLPSHRSLVLTYIHTCTSCTCSHTYSYSRQSTQIAIIIKNEHSCCWPESIFFIPIGRHLRYNTGVNMCLKARRDERKRGRKNWRCER